MDSVWFKLRALYRFWEIISKGESIRDFILAEPVRIFEKQLAEFCGSTYALGVASGTDALILSLKSCGIGPGDEVIVPAVGFYSTAGVIAWVNAKPVFVDVDIKSYNIDVSKIEAAITPRTRAIIPVHLNGRMADMGQVMQIAKRKSLPVIVDAAHAIGSRYQDKPISAFGDIVCLSFNFTKTFGTYGDGGAILTNDDAIAEKIKRMRIYGAPRWSEIHANNQLVGVASRLDVFQAAVLNEKLSLLDAYIAKQRENYFLYKNLLQGVNDLKFPEEHRDYFINGYRLPVLIKERDELLNFLTARGEKVYNWYPVPLPYLPAFKNLRHKRGDFPAAEKIAKECLILPTHYSLTQKKIINISNLVKHFFDEARA